jgi:cobalt-zinc-cadmium efflux system outer membrane protein
MEARRVQLVLRDQLADSFRRYRSARNQVEQFQKTILPDAKENLRLVTRGQEQGEFSLFQVLTARQTYSRTRLAYVESLADLQKVVVEIQGLELTGGLNPATLGAAIQTQGAQRQAGLLNQLQEGATQQSLPAAVQSIGP